MEFISFVFIDSKLCNEAIRREWKENANIKIYDYKDKIKHF